MLRTRAFLLVVLLAALLTPAAARAASSDEFQRFFGSGVRLLGTLDFERSLEQFRAARQQPHGPDEDVQLSLYEGILLYELGRDEEGQAAFRTALSLNAAAQLPVAASPRIRQALESQREHVQKAVAPPSPAPGPAPAPAPKAEPVRAPLHTSQPARRSQKVPIALVVVGSALAAAGAGALGWSWYEHGEYESGDLTRTQARTAKTTAEVSVGAMAVGGASLVAGIILFFVPTGPSISAGIAPTPGGAYGSVTVPLP